MFYFSRVCEIRTESDFSVLSQFLVFHPFPVPPPPPFNSPTTCRPFQLSQLKQMKELEQEKDSLLAGLEVVERARDWYQGQIHNVTERQRQVGQNSHCTDFLTEANQSRMNVLIPKLQEVNRCLNDLISCSGMQSFPSGGAQTAALSTSSQPPPPAPPQAIQRLKDQNRLLTQEVTERSERIAQLEQEKSALIKQLFEARARSVQDTSAMDSTFI